MKQIALRLTAGTKITVLIWSVAIFVQLLTFSFIQGPAFFIVGASPLLLVLLFGCCVLSWIPYARWRQVFGSLFLSILLCFYLISFISLYTTQHFLGYDSVRFLLNNPGLIIKQLLHMQLAPTLLFLISLGVLPVFFFLIWPTLERKSQNTPWISKAMVMIYIALLPVAILFIHKEDSISFFRTEPLGALIFTDSRAYVPEEARLNADEIPFLVENRPIISTSDYLKSVDVKNLKKRNVIVILVESLRPDQLSSFGGSVSVMENVDHLAQQSTLFTDTYAQSTHSSYADPSPFSSHYPMRSRFIYFYPETPPYPRVFIYDLLKSIGYRTAIFSSQDERWGNMHNYLSSPSLDVFFHAKNYSGHKPSGKVDDSITISKAIEWIDAKKDIPFFLYLNTQNSHVPYVVPENFPNRFGPRSLDFNMRFGHLPADKVRDAKGRYSDSLAYTDAQLGRLFQFLRNQSLLQDTLVVIVGDNGQAFGEHGFADHASFIYEEAVRVPLIFYIPWISTSKKDSRPAQQIDIAPTILSLLHLPPHPSFQGINLTDPNPHMHRTRFLLTQSPLLYQYAVVKDGYKFLWTPYSRHAQLFNLKNDPAELNDLAVSDQKTTQQLGKYLRAWSRLHLRYYNEPELYQKFYPPFIVE